MFCPKCGSLLMPKNGKMCCSTHGEVNAKVNISEKTDKKAKLFSVDTAPEESTQTVDNECPKCKNRKAEAWMRQTRSADEAPTRFYKCKKCSHMWKEYS